MSAVVNTGDRFMFTVTSGEQRGPYTVEEMLFGGSSGHGLSQFARLSRDGTEQPAYATVYWLTRGRRSDDGVGWERLA